MDKIKGLQIGLKLNNILMFAADENADRRAESIKSVINEIEDLILEEMDDETNWFDEMEQAERDREEQEYECYLDEKLKEGRL